MQSSTVKPSFEELSPDLQWHICQRRERVELAAQMGAIAAIGALALPMIHPALNKQMDISLHEGREIKVWGVTVYSAPPALEAIGVLPPEALQTVEVGDSIAGHEVNSGYGMRVHPIHGDERMHNGVDLLTDEGVPIYAPGAKSSRVKVDCKNQPGGAGLYAEISSPDIPGLKFQAMHLSDCATGLHAGGEVIARTGNSGGSTGPHLHWSQIDSATMEYQKPQKGFLQWAMTGQPPKTLKELKTTAIPLQDGLIKCAIGAAEGTLNDDCSPNQNHSGHRDPGNGVWNLGAFSYQHGASSPEEADRKQLEYLKGQIPHYQQLAREKFGKELSQAALLSVLDLHNQAPAAAADMVTHLPSAAPSPQEIIDARAKSFVNPNTQQLEAPGLGNSMDRVQADQQRRTNEVLEQLNKSK